MAAFSPVPTPRPAPCKSSGTRPDLVATRRGRRPRRPFSSSIATSPRSSIPPVGAGLHPRPAFVHNRRYNGAQGLRAAETARKGGTPGEGSPFDPLLHFFSTRGFRALRRASKGSAPGPRPLFCKKAGQKTFTGPDFCQPKPLAVAASDTIRPRSGHLSGRVAPPTRVGEAGGSRNLTGAPPPQRFSLGLHPVSLGKTKEMGWNRQHNVKNRSSKPASSSTPPRLHTAAQPTAHASRHRQRDVKANPALAVLHSAAAAMCQRRRADYRQPQPRAAALAAARLVAPVKRLEQPRQILLCH